MFSKLLTPSPARLIQFDFLRGVAILLVLGVHTVIDPNQAGFLTPLAVWWATFGWTGVDLFFVLSGFLVGGLLLKEIRKNGQSDIKRFIIRRTLKIWPTYLVYIFLYFLLLIGQRLFFAQGTWSGILQLMARSWTNFLQVQNYFCCGISPHLWSLAVEEHFYLLLPLLLYWLTKPSETPSNRISWLPLVTFVIAVASLSLRFLNWSSPYGESVYAPTHLRIDSLMFGVLLAYLFYFKPDFLQHVIRYRYLLLAIGILLVTPMMIIGFSPVVWTIGFTMIYVGYGFILLAILFTPLRIGPWLKTLIRFPVHIVALIGFYSYAIYLFHFTFAQPLVARLFSASLFASIEPTFRWVLANLVYIILSFAFGFAISELIEKPTLALRDRLFPGRVQAFSTIAEQPQHV